jgi:alpha-tubulin suppressor-like RCC1 family protein
VAQVAAGEHHSLALATDGSVCSWGGNMCGELGLGPDVEWRHRPARVRLPA